MPETPNLCDRCGGKLKPKFTQIQITVQHGGALDTRPLDVMGWNLCEGCAKDADKAVRGIEQLMSTPPGDAHGVQGL